MLSSCIRAQLYVSLGSFFRTQNHISVIIIRRKQSMFCIPK